VIVAVGPMRLPFYRFQRNIVRGLTAGAVKS
jgi:ABC-type maltose transport system permease subunit